MTAREIRFEINDGNFQSSDSVQVEVRGINDQKPEVQYNFDYLLYLMSKFSKILFEQIMHGSTDSPFDEIRRIPTEIVPNLELDDPDKDPYVLLNAHLSTLISSIICNHLCSVDYIFNVTVSICQDGVCPDRIDWSPDIAFETLVCL